MKTFVIGFKVDGGRRTEITVNANTLTEAQKIVKSHFPNSRVDFCSYRTR